MQGLCGAIFDLRLQSLRPWKRWKCHKIDHSVWFLLKNLRSSEEGDSFAHDAGLMDGKKPFRADIESPKSKPCSHSSSTPTCLSIFCSLGALGWPMQLWHFFFVSSRWGCLFHRAKKHLFGVGAYRHSKNEFSCKDAHTHRESFFSSWGYSRTKPTLKPAHKCINALFSIEQIFFNLRMTSVKKKPLGFEVVSSEKSKYCKLSCGNKSIFWNESLPKHTY